MTRVNASSTISWNPKLTRAAPIEASGRISRGNATFETRFALPTIDVVACPTAVENSVQATIPDSRNTGKSGIPDFRKNVKTTPKTARYSSGLSIDQTTPRALVA